MTGLSLNQWLAIMGFNPWLAIIRIGLRIGLHLGLADGTRPTSGPPPMTFRILTEAGDTLTTEAGDPLRTE